MGRLSRPETLLRYFLLLASKSRLKTPKKPCWAMCPPLCAGLRKVAHRAGVSTNATTTESSMAETMVSENWR